MEDMALRESPVRTLACLTANRANTQRYSGPLRAASKARVALNALQHGGRIDPASAGKSSSRAGDREGEARYRTAPGRGSVSPVPRRNYSHLWDGQALRGTAGGFKTAAAPWCLARDLVRLRAKPECPLVSWGVCSRLYVQSRIQMVDWTQLRGGTFTPEGRRRRNSKSRAR